MAGQRMRDLPDTRLLPSAATPEQARRAALVVCDHAVDTADARQLLDELGLLEILSEITLA